MGQPEEKTSENVKNMIIKRRKFLIVVAAFALLGATLLTRSQASTTAVAIEAEAGTLSGNTAPGQTAGASGDASVKFGLGGTNPNPPTPPPSSGDGQTAAAAFNWGEPAEISDEFNYGSEESPAEPDPSKWGLPNGGGCYAGHAGNGQRCGKNSRVVGGILRMTGEANGDTGWMAQEMDTQYGRWELRGRAQNTGDSGEMYHHLFLIWPTNEQWPEGGEYDFLENHNPDSQCSGHFIHYPHPSSVEVQQEGGWETTCPMNQNEWHNYAFEWTADHVAGFIDGVEVYRYSGGENENRQCIQCMESGHLNIQLDNFSGDNMRPAVFEVDWSRFYPVE